MEHRVETKEQVEAHGAHEIPRPRRDPKRRVAEAPRRETNEFDPKLLWVTLRHNWTWATPVGFTLAIVAAYFVYSQFVPLYQATHLLEANQDYIVFDGVMPVQRNLQATERNLINTDPVLDAVLSDPAIQSLPDFAVAESSKNMLRSNLAVGNAGVETMLTISFTHPSPDTAALVCNKITEAYLVQRERFDNERVSNLESWLAPSIDLWKSEVQTHANRVRELSKTALGYDPNEPVQGLEHDLSILGSLRMQLANLIVEESILEARVAMNDGSANLPTEPQVDVGDLEVPEPTTAELELFVRNDPEVAKQRGLLTHKQSQVRSLEDGGLTSVRQAYYQELKDAVADQESVVAKAEAAARAKAPEVLRRNALEVAQRNRIQNLKQQQASTSLTAKAQKQELAELKAKRAIVQQEYDIEKARLEQQGGNAADLRFAQEDREIAVGILTQLNQRLAAIRTERRRGSGVHTLAEATPPSKPIEPLPLKNMFVASAGAFVFPFLIGLLFEFRSQRICDSATLEGKVFAPLVGEVAKLPSKVGGGKRQRVFEESIDSLRANLMLSKETRGVRSIAIASSMSGEGKSSVSSQLAISLAKACGNTVLLIDGDLRSPDQHDIFGLEMGPGLAKVLTGEVTLEDAVDTSLGNLVHVLPAGRMHMSPHRLLNASALRDLLDQALQSYAYVVIDTAPVLAAGETLAIASEVDATLICVMRDVSRTDTVVRSSRRLEAAGANLVGTVFSGVPSSQYAYRYGDYRYLMPTQKS